MKHKWIEEPARRVPVSAAYDVVVIGGGIAGVAAALALQTDCNRLAALDVEALQQRLRRQKVLIKKRIARPATATPKNPGSSPAA